MTFYHNFLDKFPLKKNVTFLPLHYSTLPLLLRCLLSHVPGVLQSPLPLLALANHIARFEHGNYFCSQLLLTLLARHRQKHGGAHYQGSETTCSTVSQLILLYTLLLKRALSFVENAADKMLRR